MELNAHSAVTDQVCRGWQSERGCSIPTDRSVSEFQTAEYVAQLSTQSEPDMSGSQSSSVYDPTCREIQLLHRFGLSS